MLLAAALGLGGCRGGTGAGQDLATLPARPLAELLPPEGAWQRPKHPEVVDRQYRTPGPAGQHAGPAPPEHWGQLVHRVRADDTLYGLARTYYGDARHWRLILDRNRATAGETGRLAAGTLIYLPLDPLRRPDGSVSPPGRRPDYYCVGPGDTLAAIAERFLAGRAAAAELARLNHIANPNQLQAGTLLVLPTGN